MSQKDLIKMPYAYGATIEHEFDVDHLNIWLTFRHPMDQNVKPSNDLWTLTVDDIEKAISSSAWQDEFTLLLVSDEVTEYPDRVLLAYDGPDDNLRTTWGKQWEPWEDSLSEDIGKGKCFVDRGDPSSTDFSVNDWTKDGDWHELDLSGIVPENATAVLFYLGIRCSTAGKRVYFRKAGNSNEFNYCGARSQVANVAFQGDYICPLSTDRKIEYFIDADTWSAITFTVKGWFF